MAMLNNQMVYNYISTILPFLLRDKTKYCEYCASTALQRTMLVMHRDTSPWRESMIQNLPINVVDPILSYVIIHSQFHQ